MSPITTTYELVPARELRSADEFIEQGMRHANQAMNVAQGLYRTINAPDKAQYVAIAQQRLDEAIEDMQYVEAWYEPFNNGIKPSRYCVKAYSDWQQALKLRKQTVLRYWLDSVTEFTMDDLPFLLNGNENPWLNSFSKQKLVEEFYAKHPDAPRASNIMDGTYLYNANPDCNHKSDPNSWSGVHCLNCGGWFCL